MKHRTWLGIVGLGLSSLVLTQGCAEQGHMGHDKEENEVKVALKDAPAPVQATLKREAGAAMIDEVDKETDHGKVIYEADAKIDGKNYEIKVAEDGTLIAKKLDDEKDEEKYEKK